MNGKNYSLALAALVFAGFAPVGRAADVDIAPKESNKHCPEIVGASSATPIRITCQVAHHYTDNDKIRQEGVVGNTAANGTFYVDVIDSTHYDLYAASGPTTAVASNGTWSNGDVRSVTHGGIQTSTLVTAKTLKSHPRIGVDPDGNLIKMAASVGNGLLTSIVDSGNTAEATYTRAHGLSVGHKICVYGASDNDLECSGTSRSKTITAVPSSTKIQWTSANVTDGTYNNTNLTVSAWAQGGNRYWPVVASARATMIAGADLPLRDGEMNNALNLAIICHIDRDDTAACDAAKKYVNRPEVMGANFGCDTSGGYCLDGKTDYIGGYLMHWATAYSLIDFHFSGPEKTVLADKIFNDASDSCTPLTRSTLTGTVSSGAGSTTSTFTMTGTGTAFLSELSPGSAIVPTKGTAYGSFLGDQYTWVVSVESNTSATVTGSPVRGTKATIAPWQTGNCGAMWYTKHHMGTPFGQPTIHQPLGGNTLEGVSSINNMGINRSSGLMFAGLALADTSAKARSAVAAYSGYWMNWIWPLVQGWWGAHDMQGGSYSYTRGRQEMVGVASLLKSAVTGGPDLTAEPYFDESASLHRFMVVPNYSGGDLRSAWSWGGSGTREAYALNQLFPYGWVGNRAQNPTSTDVRQNAYWLDNYAPVGGTFYSGIMFLRADPTVDKLDYRNGPTQRVWDKMNRTGCLANGYLPCGSVNHGGQGLMISRKSWTGTTDSVVGVDYGAFYLDKNIQEPMSYIITRAGRIMMGRDFDGASAQAGVPAPTIGTELVPSGLTQNDGEYSHIRGRILSRPHFIITERWRGGTSNKEGNPDNKVAYLRLNGVNAWQSGVNTLTRDVAHFKASGADEYVVIFNHLVTASGRTLTGYDHFHQNGQNGSEGTSTCPSDSSCSSINTSRQVDSTGPSSATPISVKWSVPSGQYIFLSAAGSFPKSYSGGNGNTARVSVCAGSGSCSSSATALEYMMVVKMGTSVELTHEFNPDSNWYGAQLENNWTVMKARGATLHGAMPSVTTDQTTKLFVIGLEPGAYEVREGGVAKSSCDSIVVASTDTTLLCEGVVASAVTVVKNGAGPAPMGRERKGQQR